VKSYFPASVLGTSGSDHENGTDNRAELKVGFSMLEYKEDPYGNRTTFTYADKNADNLATEVQTVHTSIDNHTTTYQYDSNGHVTMITDFAGRKTKLSYGEGGQGANFLTSVDLPAPTGSMPSDGGGGPKSEFRYDSRGRINYVKDADENVTEYSYNEDGNVLTITHPDDGVEKIVGTRLADYSRNFAGSWSTGGSPNNFATFYPTDVRYREDIEFITPPMRSGQHIDQLGRTSTFKTNAAGLITQWTDAAGHVTDYVRNDDGFVTKMTSPALGDGTRLVTEYEYNALNNLVEVTHPDLTTQEWDYDSYSRVTSYTDELDGLVVYDWHPSDQYSPGAAKQVTIRQVVDTQGTESTDPDDLFTDIYLTSVGLLQREVVRRRDYNGTQQYSFVTEYAYTSGNRWLESITRGGDDPLQSGFTLKDPVTVNVELFDVYGNPTRISDEEFRDTHYIYDRLNRLTTITLTDPDDTGGQPTPVTEFVYTDTGRLQEQIETSVESPTTRIVTRFEYHHHDFEKIIENYVDGMAGPGDDVNVITQFIYDKAHNLTTVIDPLGRTTTYLYNLADRPIQETAPDPDGPSSSLLAPSFLFAYDALGRLINERDPRGNTTHTIYDKRHRPTSIMEPMGATTTFVYDAAGQLDKLIDPEARTTDYNYDSAGRVTELRLPGQSATPIVYKYDTANNLRILEDQLDKSTEYQYDDLLRLSKEIDSNGDDVEYTYYKDGQIKDLKDAKDYTTTWSYDLAGRVATETNTSPLSDARSYKYDEFSRLVELTDRNERVTKYEYDKLDRLTFERWYANASDPSPDHTITFDYDVAGQLEYVGDSFAEYDFDYDNLGRATGIIADLAGVTPDVTFTQAFDAVGNRTKLSAEIGTTDDFVNNYTFDALDRITRITQVDVAGGNTVADKRVDFSYLRDGRFSSITRYEDLWGTEFVGQSHFNYDATGRLKVLRHRSGTTTFADYGFTYDAANRLTGFTNSKYPTENRTYTYDIRGQLLGATGSASESYTYDDNGNRDNGGFTPGTNNRLTTDGTYNYTYDDEGNITKRTKISDNSYTDYAWDHRNRLTSVTDKTSGGTQTQQITYSYDAFNRLVKRTYQTTSGGAVTAGYFVYDGDQMVLELEPDADVAHRLLWGPAVDQALADEVSGGGEVHWYFTDHLGTVRDVATYNTSTNVTTIANHIVFDSHGKRTSETNSSLGDFDIGFTGKWFDRATGLQWNVNRWYNPAIQRWMSEDPIGFAGGDANLSRYVSSAPTMYVDPDGLAAQEPSHGYWGGVGQVFVGYGNAAVGTVKGAWFIVRHPIQTAKGVGTAIRHPILTGQAICEDVYNKSGTLQGQGELVGDVLIGVASGGAIKAASKSATVARLTSRTNPQLVDDIAERAARWGDRRGLQPSGAAGSLQHGYAKRLLDRYQDMHGQRGLHTEVRYVNRRPWESGMPCKGSVILDVVEGARDNPIRVYDYKFWQATMEQRRIEQMYGVSGIPTDVPIIVVKPKVP
jgi:RHS repeat-associated protein